MKSIIIAGSRGIGKCISDNLKEISDVIISTNSKQVDTTKISDVKSFVAENDSADVLVLNTGGPPAMDFFDITEELWIENFNRLFLSFCILLKSIRINKGGYVFLISSFNIKEPDQNLILSNSFRLAFTSVFKSLSKRDLKNSVSYINIAPGPMKTDRLSSLLSEKNKTFEQFASELPTKSIGDPNEIGLFVKFVVENKIKSLNGLTINFDMGLSNYVL
tara:strand:+ start:3301 stop:3957 length:657 start_codon:yes stop_codon:yes gene_type:complete